MISNELLKQKILDQAIHGRLVENDLSLEPIDVEEVKENTPFEIPSNWRWTKFEYIGCSNIGLTYKPENMCDDGIAVLRSSNIQRGKLNLLDLVRVKCNINSNQFVQKNDILICARNGSKALVGKSALIKENKESMAFGAFMTIFRTNYYSYIYWFMQTKLYYTQLNQNTNTMTINQLTQKKLNSLIVPLPPLEEQKRIVDKIEELFILIDRKENNDKEKEKLKLLLKDKILDQAIHGRLVKNNLSLKSIDVEEIKDNVSFEIPNNWKWSKLKKVVEINPRNKIYDNIKVDFIEMSNIKAGYLNEYQFEEKQWKNVKSSFTHIKQDDVIIAKITPCFQNKKSVYLYNLPNKYGAATTELHVLRNTYNKMYMPYLLWFVKRNNFIEEGKNHFTGTAGQLRIPKKWLEDLKVPIPPLEEQKRIVEKIENLFALIDKL